MKAAIHDTERDEQAFEPIKFHLQKEVWTEFDHCTASDI